MGGLIKRGPKRKKKNKNKSKAPRERSITDDDFKRMMEDSPSYKRHNGVVKQVR